jgi:hypothetical protein
VQYPNTNCRQGYEAFFRSEKYAFDGMPSWSEVNRVEKTNVDWLQSRIFGRKSIPIGKESKRPNPCNEIEPIHEEKQKEMLLSFSLFSAFVRFFFGSRSRIEDEFDRF